MALPFVNFIVVGKLKKNYFISKILFIRQNFNFPIKILVKNSIKIKMINYFT